MTPEQKIFDRYCEKGYVSGSVATEAIDAAQTELGILFPSDYRDFLRRYGAALADGVEVYGLPDPAENDPPMFTDVVSVTQKLRSWGQFGAEDPAFMPFSHDGMSTYLFFNTRVAPATEIWAFGPWVEAKLSNSFYGFLVDWIEGRMSF